MPSPKSQRKVTSVPKLSLNSNVTLVFSRAEEGDASRLTTILLCVLMRWGSEATLPSPLVAHTVTLYLREDRQGGRKGRWGTRTGQR